VKTTLMVQECAFTLSEEPQVVVRENPVPETVELSPVKVVL
jgi:hypothetical protein